MFSVKDDARTWVEIDLGALKHNLDYAKSKTSRRVMCVIKANAYGHGAVRCGKFLEENGAGAFAVACLAEAIELREGGITLPILILGHTSSEYASALAHYDITQTLVDEEAAKAMSLEAKKAGVIVKAHIKLDTGMSRTGLFAQGERAALEAADAAERIMALPNIEVTGMFTHFSVADTPSEKEYTAFQLENYKTVMDALTARGKRPKTCHASNSAAIMTLPDAYLDMVREGIILYGMYPDSVPVKDGPLEPVMTMKSRVSQVRELPKGTTISYGRTYMADKDMVSAVVLAGYADGFPRRASNAAVFTVNGQRIRQVGRVCMDMMMTDATGSNVKRGDEVILFGKGGMSCEELSQIVGTINYELTCLVTPRTKRIYIVK